MHKSSDYIYMSVLADSTDPNGFTKEHTGAIADHVQQQQPLAIDAKESKIQNRAYKTKETKYSEKEKPKNAIFAKSKESENPDPRNKARKAKNKPANGSAKTAGPGKYRNYAVIWPEVSDVLSDFYKNKTTLHTEFKHQIHRRNRCIALGKRPKHKSKKLFIEYHGLLRCKNAKLLENVVKKGSWLSLAYTLPEQIHCSSA
ncbi:hypothetical protein BX070DRAFT_246868 [Coemansia spiralis]|nr:hypothetical protein BX070DRAFT_246868 [Coemansia spiralis]